MKGKHSVTFGSQKRVKNCHSKICKIYEETVKRI